MVTREQQAVFQQQQAQVVGGVARGVNHQQGVGDRALQPPARQGQALAIGQCAVGHKVVRGTRGGRRGQAHNGRSSAPRLHTQLLELGRARGVVRVRVGADDEAHIATGSAPQALLVFGLERAGVDHGIARGRVAHQVAVGAGAGHETGVGRRQALQVFAQRHRALALPLQRVGDLAIGADQLQLAELHFVLHVARLFAMAQTGTRGALPQRLLAGHGVEHGLGVGKGHQAL